MTTAVEVPCSLCGHPITVPADVYAELTRLGGAARHGDCATQDQRPAPRTRPYTATVTITRGPWWGEEGDTDTLATFTVHADAPSLDAAMRGALSDNMRDRWLTIAEKANLADTP